MVVCHIITYPISGAGYYTLTAAIALDQASSFSLTRTFTISKFPGNKSSRGSLVSLTHGQCAFLPGFFFVSGQHRRFWHTLSFVGRTLSQ
jgi:hypothetical protein